MSSSLRSLDITGKVVSCSPCQVHAKSMNDLFTVQSLLSFSGAVIAATLVPNVLATVATLQPRLLRLISLIVAVALALLMAYSAQDTNWTKWLVAFFNGLLIYLSASGANQHINGHKKAGDKRWQRLH